MLRTRFTELLGLRYPIMSAPMATHSGGALAAAVSAAGGLGSFGAITPAGADWVREQIRLIRSTTDRPFGVGFITQFIPMFEQNLEVALAERVPVLAFSFGDAAKRVAKAKEAGAVVICQVQTFEAASEPVAAGADVLVAQGNEAGGHTGTMNLLPLLTRLLDQHADVPVLAAGGIATGRALAAVLAAGADGAWVGTALLATPEAVEVSDEHKRRIVASDGQDTVFTEVFDIAEARMYGMPEGFGWPKGIAGRVQRNRFTEEWHGREGELRSRLDEIMPSFKDAQQRRDPEQISLYMGQSAAFVDGVRPAAEVVRAICEDAERLLRERPRDLLA